MTAPTINCRHVRRWASRLRDWKNGRIEVVFIDPATNDVCMLVIERLADLEVTGQQALRIKAQHLARLALSQKYRPDYERFFDGFLAELGAEVPAARRP